VPEVGEVRGRETSPCGWQDTNPDWVPAVTNPSELSTGAGTADKPWFWEGHVQSAVVDYLRRAGYQIKSFADTASKQPGKDVIAIAPSGKTLWITAKGYPVGTVKTNPHTQARHWIAHALFDLILWHGEEPSVALGLAIPRKDTYRKLVSRANWFLSAIQNCIYWVDEDGTVTVENCSRDVGD
jgi:hypothetical protein